MTNFKERFEVKEIGQEDKEYFQRFYKQHNVIGLMREVNNDCSSQTVIIVKMKPGYRGWTPTGTVRDCGDHYIIARYSRYDSLNKKTYEYQIDVEDR